jgi:hypothetical protein
MISIVTDKAFETKQVFELLVADVPAGYFVV